MWDKIVADSVALRSMKALDAYALEALCESYSRYHQARIMRAQDSLLAVTSQGLGVSPLVRIEAEASREFRSWCSEFGLTPAAEVKIASTKEPGGDSADLF
jgi:P27 family predicted phage terminase small subunit